MPKSIERSGLEAQLTELTREFVSRLVEVIRNASFADVAALSPQTFSATPPAPANKPGTQRVQPKRSTATGTTGSDGARPRQTAARRAELGERLVRTLRDAGRPLGVRALANELGLAVDLLAAPLRELRAAGRIEKLGEKRSTTYGVV